MSLLAKMKPISDEFEFVGETGIDERKRISLTKAISELMRTILNRGHADAVPEAALRFHVYLSKAGQILLDPAVSVPARELWLYQNPIALAKVREGLAQAAEGQGRELGDFTKYADDEIE